MPSKRSNLHFWTTLMCWGLLASVVVAHAQSTPQLAAAWEPSGLRVEWSGAPDGSCLYLDGQFVPVPCGASGSALLHWRGVDTAYAVEPDDQLALAVDTTGPPSATVAVPRHAVILPVVVAP